MRPAKSREELQMVAGHQEHSSVMHRCYYHVDHDTTVVQAKTLLFGENKLPDGKPEHMRRVK